MVSGNGDYQAFLARKQQLGGMAGFEPLWLPDWLKDFQKLLTGWSIRRGRTAILADCGMGKTPMELVWADLGNDPGPYHTKAITICLETTRATCAKGSISASEIGRWDLVDRFRRWEAEATAVAECERCKGRQNGDCDSACRYWLLTATEAEQAEVQATGFVRRNGRHNWDGPVSHDQRLDKECA